MTDQLEGFSALADDDLLDVDGGCCLCCPFGTAAVLIVGGLVAAAVVAGIVLVVGCGLAGLALNQAGAGTLPTSPTTPPYE